MKIIYNGKLMTVDETGVIDGDSNHTFKDGVVYYHNRPEGEAEIKEDS
jgi:hypothetical protein